MEASIMNVRSMKLSPVADSNENRPTREGSPWSPEHAQVLLCIMETSMCVCPCVCVKEGQLHSLQQLDPATSDATHAKQEAITAWRWGEF